MVECLIFVACHAAMTAVVFKVARALYGRIGSVSELRRYHGWYVMVWSVGAFAIGPFACFAIFGDGPTGSVAFSIFQSYVTGMFFMLAGWMVGTIHGGIVLIWRWFVRRRHLARKLIFEIASHGDTIRDNQN